MPARKAGRRGGSASSKRSGSKTGGRRAGNSNKKPSRRRYGPKAQQEVRTEMHHMEEGKHPVKNRKQAIAIGLSKARQKGAKVPPVKRGSGAT